MIDAKRLVMYLRNVARRLVAGWKWHLGHAARQWMPTSRGFKSFFGTEPYSTGGAAVNYRLLLLKCAAPCGVYAITLLQGSIEEAVITGRTRWR